jgi:hypothetical protein
MGITNETKELKKEIESLSEVVQNREEKEMESGDSKPQEVVRGG